MSMWLYIWMVGCGCDWLGMYMNGDVNVDMNVYVGG